LKRGDFVTLSLGDERMNAMVVMASPNEDSLAVMFDGIFAGYVQLMPLLREDGMYHDLLAGRIIKVIDLEKT
jgi:hypothetical protein